MPAALVDVDGTLVDTNYLHVLAWCRAFARFGRLRRRRQEGVRMGVAVECERVDTCGVEAEQRHFRL